MGRCVFGVDPTEVVAKVCEGITKRPKLCVVWKDRKEVWENIERPVKWRGKALNSEVEKDRKEREQGWWCAPVLF